MIVLRRLGFALWVLLFLAAGQVPMAAAGSAQAPAADPAGTATTTVQQPQTNEQIRQWYNDQVSVIPALNEQWLKDGLSAEERARRAQDIRHAARLKAREFMPDRQEVAELQARDREKYGNPDGPTFDQLVRTGRKKGLEGDAVYEDIIKSASRTSKEYNNKYGVKPAGAAP
jgi:hypothetical protein